MHHSKGTARLSHGPARLHLFNVFIAMQSGLSFLFQPKHTCGIWAGFALRIPAHAGPFHQEGLIPPQTRCLAHWLPWKDLSPASGLRGPFFIQLPPYETNILCPWSPEEDEGWAGAEGAVLRSEQVTVTWDARASGWKMGFIRRHK